MDTNTILIQLGLELGKVVTKSTQTFITDKIKKSKASGDKDNIILELEGIIDELILDKRTLIEIAQKYEEVTSFQKITPTDVEYITTSILPVLEEFLTTALALDGLTNEKSEEIDKMVNLIKPILSVETFNILQMLGFNFRDAIGQPLTQLMQKKITNLSNNDLTLDLQISNNKVNEEYYRFLQNPDAVEIHKQLNKI